MFLLIQLGISQQLFWQRLDAKQGHTPLPQPKLIYLAILRCVSKVCLTHFKSITHMDILTITFCVMHWFWVGFNGLARWRHRINKRLSKQSTWRWFETPSCSLWRHCNDYVPWSAAATPWCIEMSICLSCNFGAFTWYIYLKYETISW